MMDFELKILSKRQTLVFILLMAGYYAWLGISIFSTDSAKSADASVAKLETALKKAKDENKPVFIDFWASWCKNCLQMERSTFKDAKVRQALSRFVVVKFQAEDPDNPKIKEILNEFKIMGLPGYVVLTPKKAK